MPLRRFSVSALALCLAWCLPACSQEVKKPLPPPFVYAPDVPALVYYPMTEGSTWTYDVEMFEPDGSVSGTLTLFTHVERADSTRAVLVAGSERLDYRFTPGGILKVPGETPLIPQPVTVGTRFAILSGDARGEGRIVSVSEKASVPAGDFSDCLLIEERFPDDQAVIRSWYAPRVGLVQIENLLTVEGTTFLALRARLRIFGAMEKRAAP